MEVKNLHLEITTYCNASCPMCLHDSTGKTHPLLHLSLNNIKKIISNPVLQNIDFVQLCGTHGDPIMHKDILDLIQLIKKYKPKTQIEISTNGSIRTNEFWSKLANVLDERDRVIFGIDGLSDTHHLYRRNTNFDDVIANAKSFIKNNGTAWWQFIPFLHNQHQIIDAYKLSQDLGFAKFFVKYERACYGDVLKAPTLYATEHKELIYARPSISSKNTFVHSSQFSKNCIHLTQKSIYVKADGTVTPCCFMNRFPFASLHYKNFSQQEIDDNINLLTES